MGLNKRILIVDDEQIMRDLLTDYFDMSDFETETAENGQVAYGMIEQNGGINYYDLVITDVNMPVMGGVPLQKKVKENFNELPVIFMTGFGVDHVKRDVNNIEGILAKPFELNDLMDIISKVLHVDMF